MPSHTHSTQADPQVPELATALKVKTRIKAGTWGVPLNHNETLLRAPRPATGLRVKTRLKAGGLSQNHNETLVRAPRPSGLPLKTRVKA
jgi:hypothetical protein